MFIFVFKKLCLLLNFGKICVVNSIFVWFLYIFFYKVILIDCLKMNVCLSVVVNEWFFLKLIFLKYFIVIFYRI